MFCDLVESTALSAKLDPEDLREVVQAYQEASSKVIKRYDGHVAQYLGDGLLVYFGYPQAHEDDAQRAVLAAQGILKAVGGLGGRMGSDQAVQLAVRLGIHTGPVVVAEMGGGDRHELLALGETPNLAARLEQLAEPNTIVISAATERLLRGRFECRDLGSHDVKGASTPLRALQVLGESEAPSRFGAVSPTAITPLVGRAQEIGLILERWEQTRDGFGQVVLLSGEPGIGKSRLVEVLRERVARQLLTWLEGDCSSFTASTPFHSVLHLLQGFFSWDPEFSEEMRVRKMERALEAEGLELASHIPILCHLLSLPLPERYVPLELSPQEQRQRAMATLIACLLATTRTAPAVLVIEDLQWADPSTLELLGVLIDQLPTVPMLAVLTFRPEFNPPWPRKSHLNPIHLNRLTRDQAALLVGRVARTELSAALTEQLVGKTDGVPLFVEELTKVVLESSGPEDRLTELPIPSTLQDSLMARLDRLGTAKRTAQLGAVLGREFPYGLIHMVFTEGEPRLRDDLNRLEQAELLFRRGFPPEARYMFKHALIQDAAYDSLLKKKRQQVHERVAQVLEEHDPELGETQPELLAHHFAAAGAWDKAVVYCQRAGDRASERSANSEAITHLSKGLEILAALPDSPERTRQELTLQLALGSPLIATEGMSSGVRKAYSRARAICEETGESEELVFRATWGLWTHTNTHIQFDDAQELVDELRRMAQRLGDPGFLLQAFHAQWTTDFYSGSLADARKHVDEGFALYRPAEHHAHAFVYAGHDPGLCALTLGAFNLWLLGYPDQARNNCREALALAQQLEHAHSLAWAFAYPAQVYASCGDRDGTEERVEELLALSEEHGFPHWLSIGNGIHAWVLSVDGRHSEAVGKIHEARRRLHESGFDFLKTYELVLLAEVCLRAGQAEEAILALNEDIDQIRRPGGRIHEPELYRLRAELTLLQSPEDVARAETDIRQALEIARRQEAKSQELRAAMSLSRLWQRQGKGEEAREVLGEVYSWFTEGFDTADLKEAKALLEELGA
jgi:class 3 adenylate cyclase/predicted ATPase